MGRTNKDSLAKDLRRVSREIELEHIEEFGDTRPRSKTWDSKPSNKQDRRKFKQNVHRLMDDPDYLD